MVTYLIEKGGANKYMANLNGNNCLHIAAIKGFQKVAQASQSLTEFTDSIFQLVGTCTSTTTTSSSPR